MSEDDIRIIAESDIEIQVKPDDFRIVAREDSGVRIALQLVGGGSSSGGGTGNVSGPASSTDGHAALFNGATGKTLKDAGFAPANVVHTHDDRYYTESEVDALVAGAGGGLDVTSVVDYGADPTGVSSAVTSFQAAIDSFTDNTVAVIYVPGGTYSGDLATLNRGTRGVRWIHVGTVTYSTSPPPGQIISYTKASSTSDLRVQDRGNFLFQGVAITDSDSLINRPVMRIAKTTAHTRSAADGRNLQIATTVATNIQDSDVAVAITNEDTFGVGGTGNPNITAMTLVATRTTAWTPTTGTQANIFAINPLAIDNTTLKSSSTGPAVAMEIGIKASGADDAGTRKILNVQPRTDTAPTDGSGVGNLGTGASYQYGVTINPATSGLYSGLIEALYISKGSLGGITRGAYIDAGSTAYPTLDDVAIDLTIKRTGNRNPGLAQVGSDLSAGTVGRIELLGNNASAAAKAYGSVRGIITASTAGSEGGTVDVYAKVSGTDTLEASFGGGAVLGAPTGGHKGAGTLNAASTIYVNNAAVVVTGGALGTPSSGTLSACTGLPISTGVSGLGTGVAAFLATPSSANLITAVTDETGSGALVFATSPALVTPVLGVAAGTSLALSGTGGNGFLSVPLQSSNPATPASGLSIFANASGFLAWRQQSDTFVRSFIGAITANRSYTLPNANASLAGFDLANTWSANQTFNDTRLILAGATSGTTTLKAAATAGTTVFTHPAATTDLSATGGTGHVLKQAAAGGAITSATLAQSEITGLTTADSPQFTALNVGNASDTTVDRVSAGDIQVEGNRIFRVGGADVPLADGGSGASTAIDAMANFKGQYTIAASAVASSITGTVAETTLATITIPANAMGANGRVEIFSTWSYTNSANVKTLKVKFGGTQFFSTAPTATANQGVITAIANRNATNSQVGGAGANQSIGTSSTGIVTTAIDTTAAVDIIMTATLANTGETITLEAYRVVLIRP